MTGIFLSAASCSWVVIAVPSIDAMTSSLAPLVIWFSIWLTWVGMSFSAYCRSTLYPRASSCFLRLSPSWIQRSEDFVGMVTPTRAPAAPAAPLAPPLSADFVLDPHAASATARVRPTAAVANFATLLRYSFGCGWLRSRLARTPGTVAHGQGERPDRSLARGRGEARPERPASGFPSRGATQRSQ